MTGYVSAEDFEALGVPDEHHNVPGAQMGGYVSAGLMEAVTFKRWSTKAKASRKSGKYWVYKITEKGRQKLSRTAGLEGDEGAVRSAAVSGDSLQSGSASLPIAAAGLTSVSAERPGASGVNPDTTAAPSPCSSTEEQRPCKSQVAGSIPAGGSTAGPNADASSGVVESVSVGSGGAGSTVGAPPESTDPPVAVEPAPRLFGDESPSGQSLKDAA